MIETLHDGFAVMVPERKSGSTVVCCESFGGHLHAYKHDLERWQREGRDDLLKRVNRLGWIWVDPETRAGETLSIHFIDQ